MKKSVLSLSVVVAFVAYVVATLSKGTSIEPAKFIEDKNYVFEETPNSEDKESKESEEQKLIEKNGTLKEIQTKEVPTETKPKLYKDGLYSGDSVDAYYGNIKVQAKIQDGKISDVIFLDYPKDQTNSIKINTEATRQLKNEVIAAQSANVDVISGATETSSAFILSIESALSKAKN